MKKHQIRIVGGAYRRTPISVPEGEHLRPTPDRVRETLFNWLAHFWDGTFTGRRVLDLFAGTGALGFEAASRGVEIAQLVEQAVPALAGLRAVQARLKAPAIRIHTGEACAFLRAQPAPSYDLVMLDPPFGANWLPRLLPLLDRALLPGGLLYLESEAPLDALPPEWTLLRQGRAGQVHYGLTRFAATQKNMNNGRFGPS
ncbi:MAG: RsmD family RNA methyltransferase [Castellaniella sp.]|uniref:RsmD family RNA methyltransferase n=1 Tax=Castellaniella sp. TaxID=1955812 RepID=UPI002A35C192|nr:RsmD family RNA methyltransferase [Castellaniella sp.]MDY0308668.1 RsmD family RNA methyltransferase [Castellaniella sp.]